MSEAEYIVERKRLLDSWRPSTTAPKIGVALAQQIKLSDEGVHPEGQLLHHGPTTYREKAHRLHRFMRRKRPQIVKNFVQNVWQTFLYKIGPRTSIRFKNGIEHQFFCKDSE